MFQNGLVSISFRPHTVEEIVGAVKACGLKQIEWGSDVHVPAGDAARARYVRTLMEQNGLTTSSYGSYFYLGTEADPVAAFVPYLDSAELLGTKIIRLWGGKGGSATLNDEKFDALAAEGKLLADMAAKRGIVLALECHGGTLTDEYHSAVRYMQAVDHPNMRMYWQPNQFRSHEYNLEAAEALAPYTTNIHVFSWDDKGHYPLDTHTDRWHEYLAVFRKHGGDHALLLEFMHDNKLTTLPETAATLLSWNSAE